jgi:DNA-binding response OmpR family regulator
MMHEELRSPATTPDRETRVLNVVVGDSESNLKELLKACLETAAPDGMSFRMLVTPHESAIRQAAREGRIDLFILILNNMSYQSESYSADDKSLQSLQFVSRLRQESSAPIVALYGHPARASYAQDVMHAGAVYSTRLPFELPPLVEAMRALLQ